MDKPRGRAYVWVTWLPKLLAREDRCWYRLWFKSNFKFDRVPDATDRAEFFREWTAKHDAIVKDRAEQLREDGWTVKVEEDGKFTLAGDRADLAGQPDIVALKGEEGLVVDAKSGRKRASDHWQVLLYMFALPLSWLRGTQTQLRGEVEYPDGAETVRPLTANTLDYADIVNAMRTASQPAAPVATPSERECRYCDIASCTYRFKSVSGDARGIF